METDTFILDQNYEPTNIAIPLIHAATLEC